MPRPSLRLTPTGQLIPDRPGDLSSAAERGSGALLLHLANQTREAGEAVVRFWTDLGRRYLTRLAASGRLASVPAPAPEILDELVVDAPPMEGGEYLDRETLGSLWRSMDEAVAADRRDDEDLRSYLRRRAPAWHAVGRVHFHLAERKDDPKRPFAFLATYVDGLRPGGQVRHRVLSDALRELTTGGDEVQLESLLEPVRRAAQGSRLVHELLETRELFHPLIWRPARAYELLSDLPKLEHAGLVVKVPDWWTRRSRAQVQVSLGRHAPSRLGLDALVDFEATLALDGEPLTRSERERLLGADSGLVWLKGRWVEVDRERLRNLLDRWEDLAEAHRDGLSLREGLRLLAGAALEDSEVKIEEEERPWVVAHTGTWLRDRLSTLRATDSLEARLGKGLRGTLRTYQRQGVAWLETLTALGLGACLADDMGLGKTVQVLAWLRATRDERDGATLLVAPASLLTNWSEEAARFTPELRVLVAHPSSLPRRHLKTIEADEVQRHDLVLTSYGYLSRLSWAETISWHSVVLDEAQAIKNPATRAARRVKALRTTRRIAMTGTPVENRAADLWSLMDFLNPGLLGSSKTFRAYMKSLGNRRDLGYAPLRRLVQPYLLRRRKTDPDIAPELPEKTEVSAYCALTRRQVALYEEATTTLAETITRLDGIQRRGLVLKYLLRFQQICNHPSHWLGEATFPRADSGKFLRLGELLGPVARRQEKALVFTRFQKLTRPLADYLSEVFDRPGLVLDGRTPVRERGELVDRFQAPGGPPFMVLTVKAGGTGLNLTAARHVVHFDRWWNPAVEDQATDRAYRIGQSQAVLVHKLICRGTVEERIDDLLEDKARLARDLLATEAAPPVTELGDEELLDLVRLDIQRASTMD